MRECLKVAFQAAKQQNISKLVIFTARGEGVRIALEEFCSLDEYKSIRLVAVTFPVGKRFTNPDKTVLSVAIDEANEALFRVAGVPIIKAHMPFDPITPLSYKQGGNLGQDLSLIGEALNIFGGSMSLCVQAILMACDAGAVGIAEHVVAATSDTAILAQAACTSRLFGQLVIREILCKPAVLTVGRKEIAERFPAQLELGSKPGLEAFSETDQPSAPQETPLEKPKS